MGFFPNDPIPDVSGYPTVDDLVNALAGAGITITGGAVSQHLATAIAEWEKRTGYKPFLASGVTTRYYSCEEWGSDLIDLRTGIISVDSVNIRGDVLDTGDYRMEPRNAPTESEPWTYIMFPRKRRGDVSVTGRFGYSDTCPDDVTAAILARACSLVAEPFLKAAATSTNVSDTPAGSLRRVTEGGVTREWSETTSVTERRAVFEAWGKTWEDAVARYRLDSLV